jgi:hypothetical protein
MHRRIKSQWIVCLLRQIDQYIRKEWTLLKPNLDHRSPAVMCSHEQKDHLMPLSLQAAEYCLWQIKRLQPLSTPLLWNVSDPIFVKKCENCYGNLYRVYCRWFLVFVIILYDVFYSLLLVSAFVLCFSFTFFNDMFIIPIIMFLPCWNYIIVQCCQVLSSIHSHIRHSHS